MIERVALTAEKCAVNAENLEKAVISAVLILAMSVGLYVVFKRKEWL